MGIAAIVLSRFDSSRLPGKALRPIGGRPLMGRVLDRARRMVEVDFVVLATSDRPLDDPVANFAAAQGVRVFRGSGEDVAGRCRDCCRELGLIRFVRICGDSPFVDPVLADRLAAFAQAHGDEFDVVTNVFPRLWPIGNSIEVVSSEAMERLCDLTNRPSDREHVTNYFYDQPDRFRIRNFPPPDGPMRDFSMAVDDPEDLEKAEWMVRQLDGPPEKAPFERIVALARAWYAQRTA
ncbi:MAG: NTP transferase domain-containing protein [Magnetococcales bacterium]|nr:NTP transferase domain-containing protein [Magnetococcales bacterium]